MEPHHLIIIGLAGVFVFVGIALAGAIWQAKTVGVPSPDLQTKINELQAAYEKYVTPRQVSEDQIKIIEKFLLERAAQKRRVVVYYAPSNQEASEYASGIYKAFRPADGTLP